MNMNDFIEVLQEKNVPYAIDGDRGCKIICVNGIFSKTFKGLQNAYQQRSY